MSEQSNQAIDLLRRGRPDESMRFAAMAVAINPNDAHAQYAFGQCLRFSNRIPEACVALTRADALAPGDPPVLAALAIARQLNGEYAIAIDVLRQLLNLDPDHVEGYITLGMTQKLMGDFESAAHNYDEGLKALTRGIADGLRNSDTNPPLPHWHSRGSPSVEYAAYGALYLGAKSLVDTIAWPTGEIAERDALTQEFRGWYWNDSKNRQGTLVRLFLPNYFNAMSKRFRSEPRYGVLVGNRTTVLRLMGRGGGDLVRGGARVRGPTTTQRTTCAGQW